MFLFWIEVDKYLNDYKSGAKYELSEIKSEQRISLKKDIERGLITRHMFNDIKWNRDSYKFFNSNEYFRFIVTYNHRKLNENNMNKQYEWPQQFEETIEYNNKQKHINIFYQQIKIYYIILVQNI